MAPRAMKWFTSFQNDLAVADNSQANVELLDGMAIGNVKGSTITRIVLDVVGRLDTVDTFKSLRWGIVQVNSDAAAANAFPDADQESDRADWMFRSQMATIQNTLSDGAQLPRVTADLRAQRIMRSEETQLHAVFDDSGTGLGGWLVSFMIRVLMKLP